jgi:hypothetical protein
VAQPYYCSADKTRQQGLNSAQRARRHTAQAEIDCLDFDPDPDPDPDFDFDFDFDNDPTDRQPLHYMKATPKRARLFGRL